MLIKFKKKKKKKKAKGKLRKNAACHFEQTQEATSKKLLYSYLPPIFQTIQVRWKRHAGHYWEVRTNLKVPFSYRLLHMDMPVLGDQQKLTYISSV